MRRFAVVVALYTCALAGCAEMAVEKADQRAKEFPTEPGQDLRSSQVGGSKA